MTAKEAPRGRVTITEAREPFSIVMPAPRPPAPPVSLEAELSALVLAIHRNRHLGRPGDDAYFIVESADGYVQALAPPGEPTLRLEARSFHDRQAGDRCLVGLGFGEPVGPQFNAWVDLVVEHELDIAAAATLAASALKAVSENCGVGRLNTRLAIPGRGLSK